MNTESLITRDKKVIWHPFTPQKYMPEPIPIVKAEATCLFDAAGRRYIDAISSWWVTLHGHAHPYIAQKIFEQASTLEQVIFAGFTHEPAVRLAERILEILPAPMSRVFYSDNGSTSTEVAIKMSVQYWWNRNEPKRNKILAFNNSYHGDTFGAMSVSDRSVFTMAFHEKLFEVIFIDAPESAAVNYDIPWDEIACFIYEPLVQGAGGMKMYVAAGLDNLIAQCRQHQIICIADEVMTGFGRTGKLFASAYMSHQPDIICLSKGLTGGTMPLSITACNQKIYEAFVHDDLLKTFFHGHSYTANPITCAAALASLDLLLTPECNKQMQRIQQQHQQFRSELQQTKLPVRNIRVLGTIIAFEIDKGKDEYLNNISTVVTRMVMERGVYLRPLGNTLYLMPPYCITEEELKDVYKVILEILPEFA
ncbi:adenosylmethionine--8-amino-7-oxononanoate transaminase [Pseudoflavitalea sp. G-6-1-2]|uniref:adenosylmethionine--8-amino-7-oxononanoate transaminase n=1 Tax=Pseudoflavitalea sp. G-6-1-2 TaxID=2728841 RepID=UPI00146B925E|nr:adenosylmethionine--8-amino-7-oxononanoate transaminase [Pseudoflavitalea sp. G-6-1-2]NML21072.1 adenosylmethionine--8-amino-7-oxononanoate transaminase [Pseudoflavitalea sp. G-6-1-2]